MKVITVCLKERATSTKTRLNDINSLLEEVNKLKIKPSLVVFPGGTFDLKKIRLANPDKEARILELNKSGIVKPLMGMCKKHDLHLVFGIDTKDAIDQCVCHVDENGVRCITRKIFPVKGEEADLLASNIEDAKIENRVTIIKGYHFLLAACYDMYGAEVLKNKESRRLLNINNLKKMDISISKGKPGFDELKKEFILNWCDSVANSDIGIACIHAFTKDGDGSGISYWQRDGITRQFPFLKMKLVLGAAHYTKGREFPRDMSRALLADGSSIKQRQPGNHILLNGKAMIREWEIKKKVKKQKR